ncbi:hypothetical protein [Gorillibacterium sp. CAU 1737]|uniref:hypothetical protein n=1 Tax=Gorillibacterium sp. CAU 1737 TaxID=3140362 RepID=UPI003260E717
MKRTLKSGLAVLFLLVAVAAGSALAASDKDSQKVEVDTGVITSIIKTDKQSTVQILGIDQDGLVLNLSDDAVYQLADGTKLSLDDLQIGMTVEAEHAPMMTLSLPPQALTYKITVLNKAAFSDVRGTAGQIDEVRHAEDGTLQLLIKGSGLAEASPDEVVLRVTDETMVVSPSGHAIHGSNLELGAEVIAFYSQMLTKSLPPIGTAWKLSVSLQVE